jgi:hydrogenase expression/formation protein HypC
MCLGIPGRIVEFVDETHHLSRIDVAGVRRVVNVGLVLPDGLAPGDWVLIHVGFAISKIDEAEAERTTGLLRELGAVYDQELEQLSTSRIE